MTLRPVPTSAVSATSLLYPLSGEEDLGGSVYSDSKTIVPIVDTNHAPLNEERPRSEIRVHHRLLDIPDWYETRGCET